MSDNKAYFHFTLGPVQSFVAQARRTRDFWAGSFILSWLSGVAMREVIAQCGGDRNAIQFPKAEPDFLDWLDGTKHAKNADAPPQQGSIPNRFKAEINPSQFDASQVCQAVQTAWKALAEVVYDNDIKPVSGIHHQRTQEIWNRQIQNTWEMIWAITDDQGDSAILDQRKNWRSYAPPEEGGVKCMMMDGWQELSGEASPNADDLGRFWGAVKKHGKQGIKSDLREQEYLCAIAFVKRRFPRHFANLPATAMPGNWTLRGWAIDVGRPSVSYMAAAHWLEAIIKQTHQEKTSAVKDALWGFHDAAYKITKEYGSWSSDIRCIKEANPHRKWEALDGDVFFTANLENENNYPESNPDDRKEVIKKLQRLKSVSGLGEASPFYAVLMMDGDSLGKQMSDLQKQEAISAGLQTFTGDVPDIVQHHSGFLVYAGGDDVLAVLPMEDAMGCALAIRERYEAIFAKDKADHGLTTSISAAIEFAHIHMPLTKVLRDAHYLLDDIAKERCGRDALAVRVWKPGGKALEWTMPWEKSLEISTDALGKSCRRLTLERLADDFNRDDQEGQLSNGFFYKLRDQLELLNPPNEDKTGRSPLKPEQGVDLMASEYIRSGLFNPTVEKNQRLEHARYVVEPLLQQCYPHYRDVADKADPFKAFGKYQADAALLVRFLAHKGVL